MNSVLYMCVLLFSSGKSNFHVTHMTTICVKIEYITAADKIFQHIYKPFHCLQISSGSRWVLI